MNALIERVTQKVEIDTSALMHAVSVHLQVTTTLIFLEPNRFEIDPLDELPSVNTVPVTIDGSVQQFEICQVMVEKYCNPGYVLLEGFPVSDGTRQFDTYVLHKDFGDQPQLSVRVPRDLESLSDDARMQLMRDIVAEFYKQ